MKCLGIIPARYGSTRFPGKPLVDIGGKSMIRRVIDQARSCPELTEIWVATDDERILQHVLDYGCKAFMTPESCQSGTERILSLLPEIHQTFDIVLNIQGDEPFVHTESLSALMQRMQEAQTDLGTLAVAISSNEEIADHNRVKVVTSVSGRALYFSRSTIPFERNAGAHYKKHLGVYAYTVNALHRIKELSLSPLEHAESLEQLRWLENDLSIMVLETAHDSTGIDTPEDLAKYSQ